MEDISVFQSLTSMLMILLVLSIFMGILLKIYSIFLAIFAFPTYLGLYFIESSLPFLNKNGENILSLNIPTKNPQKAIMNGSATFVTLSLLPFFEVVFNALRNPEPQVGFVESAMLGKLFPPIYLVMLLIGLSMIYIISYFFSEKDKNGSWTKIENLSIPSLWKTVAKGIV